LLCIALTLTGAFSPALADDDDPPAPVLPPNPSRNVLIGSDSGLVQATGPLEQAEVVYSTLVSVPDATWLRLWFGDTTLSGDPAAEGAVIRIMSAADGGTQYLNAESLKQWSNSSAFFNGDTVLIDLIAHGKTGDSRLIIKSVTAGEPVYDSRSICDTVDDRVLSSRPDNARFMPAGCTAWLIDDANHTFLMAGHCGTANGVAQFNVPLSSTTGVVNSPLPEHQYAIEASSIQQLSGGVGNDWAYFGTFPNSNTGLTAKQAQGSFYQLAAVPPPVSGQSIRVTGYGTTSTPAPRTWSQVQKTHTGPYTSFATTTIRYRTDTTGGNSGSPVTDESTGLAIGIHTHGGCSSTGGSNAGTAVHNAGLQNALANPRGICRTGIATPSGDIFISSDLNNNFGALPVTGGSFGAIAQLGPAMQGLAFDRHAGNILGIDSARRLYTIDPGSGDTTQLGTVTATALTLTGLAFDPNARVIYAIAQSSGQLFSINATTLAATPIGAAQGGAIGGLDFDRLSNTLFGISDEGVTHLVRINVATGAQTLVGVLGAGATDCNGLAFNPATNTLYTINAVNGNFLSISPATGAATLIGDTSDLFGAAFGMAARDAAPVGCNADFDGDGDHGTDLDIEAFFACLGGNCCPTCASADYDDDGDTGTDLDIEAFFRVLGGGPC